MARAGAGSTARTGATHTIPQAFALAAPSSPLQFGQSGCLAISIPPDIAISTCLALAWTDDRLSPSVTNIARRTTKSRRADENFMADQPCGGMGSIARLIQAVATEGRLEGYLLAAISAKKQVFDQGGYHQQDQNCHKQAAETHAPHHSAAHHVVHHRSGPLGLLDAAAPVPKAGGVCRAECCCRQLTRRGRRKHLLVARCWPAAKQLLPPATRARP